ncbi:MAG: catalase [Candidatus Eremiobacteraeota bacterium]|nr:catalase [Candidatus Eremiobacteraeota bacterium]
MERFTASPAGRTLTTNQGLAIADDQNSLRAGERGPTLLEDFILREKITHFDHERIPERVVHARGAAAHGYFEVYESMAPYTKAGFLQDPAVRTPVFARFSTVGGSRGSADTPRDVRGFAGKFYTQEGNYDLVGNNMPVFFIQDSIKFPDFVHAVKPEPHNEIPQASSAHDTLWDFVSLTLESSHMMMWLMSDRALPRAYANMEGFGVHTFRFINAREESRYVKFHWKPKLGAHSLVWDEAQKLAGKDPDFNRRSLYESIANGIFPEWELGVQMFGDAEADSFDFDILDSTKLIPEELIPVQRIGRMVLDRNPDSYFAETEQVAFCTTHLVPGIGFTNDPLLQGRNFSYLDTQLSRLGGPNFHEIPINRPICPFGNGQRDGLHRMRIDTGDASYQPNSLDGGFPAELPVENGGFATYPDRVDGVMRRVRSASFADHFSQATMFYNSMSAPEKEHIIAAFSFELAKLNRVEIRERVITQMLANIDAGLAQAVAANVGLGDKLGPVKAPSKIGKNTNGHAAPASPLLSLLNPATGITGDLTTRKVAILVGNGSNVDDVEAMRTALTAAGATALVLSSKLGSVAGENGTPLAVDHTLLTMPSIVFDAVYVPGGHDAAATLAGSPVARDFVGEAYQHGKAIAATGAGRELLSDAGVPTGSDRDAGVVIGEGAGDSIDAFLEAIGNHRAWERGDIMAGAVT